MIDNTSTTNVQLTLEQLQQLDIVKKRLSNLESEIVNATKILNGTKMECDRAVKEKLYQKELLGNLTTKIEGMKVNIDNLDRGIKEKDVILSELNDEIKSKSTEYKDKVQELKDREEKIIQKEIQFSELGNKLGKQEILLNNEKADFNSKVAKLKEVISSF